MSEIELRLKGSLDYLVQQVANASIELANMAGELAVRAARIAELEAEVEKVKPKEEVKPESHG